MHSKTSQYKIQLRLPTHHCGCVTSWAHLLPSTHASPSDWASSIDLSSHFWMNILQVCFYWGILIKVTSREHYVSSTVARLWSHILRGISSNIIGVEEGEKQWSCRSEIIITIHVSPWEATHLKVDIGVAGRMRKRWDYSWKNKVWIIPVYGYHQFTCKYILIPTN